MQIIFKQIYLIHHILTGTITQGQSEPRSNGNEKVLHIPQVSWTGASPFDVQSYSGQPSFCMCAEVLPQIELIVTS